MNVLFVDDEAQVLRGIERALDAEDVEWETFFAGSGAEALELLESQDIDAIVSDMRMPGMDGAELLERVALLKPNVVRVVLSGQATKESVYRAVNPMHQYLSKPCDVGKLSSTLRKSLALRDMLHSSRLAGLVGKISKLPSTPEVYDQLVDELSSEDSNASSIGEIVSKDPAMTAKVLQIVNSAVFGLSRTVSAPAHAVGILGAETIKALVLSVGVFSEYDKLKIPGFSATTISQHSLAVAELAATIARLEGASQDDVNCAFTAGLLHDIGKLILAHEVPTEYARVLEMHDSDGIAISDAEFEVFGASHPAVGAYLFSLWGLPQSVIEAVALHHSPKMADADCSAVTIVAVADLLVNEQEGEASEATRAALVDHLEQIQLSHRLSVWEAECAPVAV